MAVVSYGLNGKLLSQRSFMVPKRAGELKSWYKAAQKAIGPRMPSWDDAAHCPKEQQIITVESIILSWRDALDRLHTVVIDRKRQLL